ncbi:MAG TPA: DUF4956 domain-containing protein [Candidatus Eisenbergiella stercorigallinarum]|uniref:DUF4956 domain-containing protein n=1 Tax=Candidatus Eisenbergiella stercorigallinarum TaxID=2838557 RepID=A0A9D2R103_9FIRM|nr:DUF4956 domain-containing protein [Candidatus Eisenbergiella stercorigallinarum]
MSFQDIIKNSFLETMENNTLSTSSICITLGIAILFGLYIHAVYYLSQKKGFYSKQFNIVLGVLPIITAGIILAMQSNLIISLGMVGALSIVRFRTAVKEPKDLLFLFWSIGIGIILGARNYELALLICLVVTLLLFLLELIPDSRPSLLLVVNMAREGREDELMSVVGRYAKNARVRSRSRTMDGTDLVIECRTRQESEFLEAVSALHYVQNASLIAHDGEAVY